MRSELGLKGNELIIYALIYGFCQSEGHSFHGSRQYISDWTGCSLSTVSNVLAGLVDCGLLVKSETVVNGVTFNFYVTTRRKREVTQRETTETRSEGVRAVIEHLNEVTGKSYDYRRDSSSKPVTARLNEGYTVEDCIKVIDVKASEWLRTDMRQYLRPETLFRASKFESYLQQAPTEVLECDF
jgi:hypothetical protein